MREIAGLTAGFFLSRGGASVRVLERDVRPGGSILTEHKDGYLVELGPNTVLANSVQVDELLAASGMAVGADKAGEQAEARKAGIEVRRYTAKPTAQREFFTEVPFDMELDGSYYTLLRFFQSVAHLDRIINVSGLKMASLRKASDAGVKKQYQYAPTETVAVTCQATTFFSRENFPGTPAPAAAPVKK